ncbi:MAG: prolipoprotein diacylglyceryl transferase [Deltaproteobacteria bacterium]|jgi:prolipoprotein diacylglyceryl transferase|nr:prolipoprotein diacylglyceryl transferase [Deltaproteobacteria bacterium]
MALVWDIDPVLFQVPGTGLAVRYYGLIFSLVFLGGFVLFYRQTRRAGGTADDAYDIILPGFVGLILGARLGHVLFYNIDRLLRDPAWLFRVWEGGLASHGATIGLALALIWYAKRHRLPVLAVTDRFSFSAALGAAMVRLGNFFNSEIVGRVTDGPFGVRFPVYEQLPPELCPPRYPSQLVEFAMGLFVLAALGAADRLLGRQNRPRGVLSALFLILYFLGRFLVEFIKERQGANDQLFLSRGQILSLPMLAIGVILLAYCLKRPVRDLPVQGREPRKPAGPGPAGPKKGRGQRPRAKGKR